MRDRLGGLFSKAASQASEGAGRLMGAAGAAMRPAVLQHALAARDRGNLEAAFWLLDEAFRESPTDLETTFTLWEVAVELDRTPDAAAAGVALVERHAAEGAVDEAVRHFAELSSRVPAAQVAPAAIVRMLPLLRNRVASKDETQADAAHALACVALENALAQDSADGASGLTPGLALHLFKEARIIDPGAATRAAEIALTSSDLHEVRREELRAWLDSVEASEVADLEEEPPPPAPEVASEPAVEAEPPAAEEEPQAAEESIEPQLPDLPDEPVLPPLSEGEVVDAARRIEDRHGPDTGERETLPERNMKVIAGVPVGFEEEALEVRLPGGKPTRVGWKEIQAVAVVELTGAAGGSTILVDCILNWRRRGREALRLVRLRADEFDPCDLLDSESADLPAFLTDLLERTQAAPLPGPESALGLQIATFESLEQYEREILGVSEAASS